MGIHEQPRGNILIPEAYSTLYRYTKTSSSFALSGDIAGNLWSVVALDT